MWCWRLLSFSLFSFLVGCGCLASLAFLQWPLGHSCGHSCQSRPILELGLEGLDKYCVLRKGLSWDDFREKGFTVVPGFLSHEEIGKLMSMYTTMQDDSVTNPGGNMGKKAGYRSARLAGVRIADVLPHIALKIEAITAASREEAGIQISHPRFEEMFFTTNSSDRSRSLNLPWHQDIENFYFFQDLRNYLDFYIFVEKPDPQQAGLSLVPWDFLRARSPELYRLAKVEQGVHAFTDVGHGMMTALDASSDTTHLLRYHLDRMACSPVLHAGDMLLFAGDVIHRTQEHKAWRISLNINVHQDAPHGNVSMAALLSGGLTKYGFMERNAQTYIDLHKTRIRKQGSLDDSDPILAVVDAALHFSIKFGAAYRRALFPIRRFLGT